MDSKQCFLQPHFMHLPVCPVPRHAIVVILAYTHAGTLLKYDSSPKLESPLSLVGWSPY